MFSWTENVKSYDDNGIFIGGLLKREDNITISCCPQIIPLISKVYRQLMAKNQRDFVKIFVCSQSVSKQKEIHFIKFYVDAENISIDKYLSDDAINVYIVTNCPSKEGFIEILKSFCY